MDISAGKEKRFQEMHQLLWNYNRAIGRGENPSEPIFDNQEYLEFRQWGQEKLNKDFEENILPLMQ